MATNAKTYVFDCPRNKRIDTTALRYFGVAASVSLPKALFLGRMVLRVTKPSSADGAPLTLQAGGPKKGAARRRGGKKK